MTFVHLWGITEWCDVGPRSSIPGVRNFHYTQNHYQVDIPPIDLHHMNTEYPASLLQSDKAIFIATVSRSQIVTLTLCIWRIDTEL